MPEVEKRYENYIVLPLSLTKECPELNLTSRNVLSFLMKYSKNGACWPSQQFVAEELGISLRSTVDHIQNLERHGYIRIDRVQERLSKSKYNIYHISEKTKRLFSKYMGKIAESNAPERHAEPATRHAEPAALHAKPAYDNNKNSNNHSSNDYFFNNIVSSKQCTTASGEVGRGLRGCSEDLQKVHNESSMNVPLRNQNKPSPCPSHLDSIPIHVKEIIDFYYLECQIRNSPSIDSKQHKKDIVAVKKALNGTLFKGFVGFENNNRKYSIDEIKESIQRHKTCFDPDYYPANKNPLNVYLAQFLFNHYSKIHQSYFVEHLINEPKRVPGQSLVGTRGEPVIVAKLMELLNVKSLPEQEMEKLIVSSVKIKEFFTDPNKSQHWNGPICNRSYSGMASIAFNAIKEDIGDSLDITPGFFMSTKTFKKRIPKFLLKNAMFLKEDFFDETPTPKYHYSPTVLDPFTLAEQEEQNRLRDLENIQWIDEI